MTTPVGSRLLEGFLQAADLKLVEAKDGKGKDKIMVRGEFARSDVPTQNKRVYPQKVWEGNLNRLGTPIKERRVIGELDHPQDGKSALSRASHVITALSLNKGIVVGEAEILNTSRGKDLKELLKAKCKIGVSSRGYGTTKPNDDGNEEVQEDYKLATFDFVADPADKDAFPDVFAESKRLQEEALTEQGVEFRIQRALNEERARVESDLRSQFSRELVEAISSTREEMMEEIRGELLTDPEVGGSRTALEKVKDILLPFILPEDAETIIARKDTEIDTLRSELAEKNDTYQEVEADRDKIANLCRQFGYMLHLERMVKGTGHEELVKKLIGDVTSYESAEDLQKKIESILADLPKAPKPEGGDQEVSEELERSNLQVEELTAKSKKQGGQIKKLKETLEKSLKANEVAALMQYAYESLIGNPKAAKILSVLDSSNVETKKDVSNIIEQFRESPRSARRAGSDIKERIRELHGRGRSVRALDEEVGDTSPLAHERRKVQEDQNFNGLGVSLKELKKFVQ
ncbi:MAG: hypothetical protein KAJ19_25685 [Gammaproteobacteria bacterium]|nr:hypothetical protein [Gammaproteobacteria bacterium]